MRAAVLTSPDAIPICAEFPDPIPFPDREPLTLVAAGIHRVVRVIATGAHYSSDPRYPLVPGVDAVARHSNGDLVYTGYTAAPWDTMAETMTTPFELRVPAGADPLAIAAGMNPGMPGFLALSRHQEQNGDLGTVLVLGATGLSGQMAVEMALRLGASRVVAVGRNRDALDSLAQKGAEPISIEGTLQEMEACVRQTPPSLIVDYLWGNVAEAVFGALLGHGDDDATPISHVQIGSLAGANATVPASLLRSRPISLSGSGIGSASPQELRRRLPALMNLIAAGALTVPYTAYPLERVAEAWNHEGRSRAIVTL